MVEPKENESFFGLWPLVGRFPVRGHRGALVRLKRKRMGYDIKRKTCGGGLGKVGGGSSGWL